jgi:phenylacetate-CoA ligase
MNRHYDALETRDPALREREQLARLRSRWVREVADIRLRRAPGRRRCGGRAHAGRARRAAGHAQVGARRAAAAAPPVRRLRGSGWGRALRVFASPGPIYEPEGAARDYWRIARALHAAGFRRGDLVTTRSPIT